MCPWHGGRRLVSALAGALALLAAVAPPARAEPRIVKGPWLMDVRPDGVAVLLELSDVAEVELVATTPGKPDVQVASARRAMHELVLTGLASATAYTYALRVAGRPVEGGSFHTAPPPGQGPVSFLVVGDNRTDAVAHAAVVAAMLQERADFVLNTGDMVADGRDDEDWAMMFAVQTPLLRHTPLFPTLGNHELHWTGSGLPKFLAYTRVPRAHGGEETYYAVDHGPLRILVLDSNDDWSGRGRQRLWLEGALEDAAASATVAHVLVAMHHGPLSSGHHGGHPQMLASGLVELLRDRGVALLLSGHDHAYERGDAGGLKYVVTGGGGAPLYETNDRLPSQLHFEASHHFVRVEVSGQRFRLEARRADGSELESCTFEPSTPWRCRTPSHPQRSAAGSGLLARGVGDSTIAGLALAAALFGAGAVWWRRRRGA